jgi:hypothetical protein
MPEHYVQEVLGHANIKTTSTYPAGTTDGLEEYFARFERKRGAREKPAEKDTQEDAHVATEQPAATTLLSDREGKWKFDAVLRFSLFSSHFSLPKPVSAALSAGSALSFA